MATPNIPQSLGNKVTTRSYDWRQMVIAEWGEYWARPDIVYVFSDGTQKESTDMYQTGIYRRR